MLEDEAFDADAMHARKLLTCQLFVQLAYIGRTERKLSKKKEERLSRD